MRSQILSGWPSDTDSLVKTKSCFGNGKSPNLRGAKKPGVVGRLVDENRCPVSGGILSNGTAEASSGMLPSAPSRRLLAAVFARPLALGGECLGEIEQAAPDRRILDRKIGVDQFDRLGPAQRVGFERL